MTARHRNPSSAVLKPGGLRLSAEPSDPGYEANEELMRQGKKAQVYLNGHLQRYATTVDESRGLVVVAPHVNGRVGIKGDEAHQITLYGDVRVKAVEYGG